MKKVALQNCISNSACQEISLFVIKQVIPKYAKPKTRPTFCLIFS